MSQAGVDYLTERVAQALDYCRKEFDMTVAEAVGALAVAAMEAEDIPEEWR